MTKQKFNGVKVNGHRGKWHSIDSAYSNGKKVWLLEHDTYGEDAAMLWVDENLNVIVDDVWNGLQDLIESEEN